MSKKLYHFKWVFDNFILVNEPICKTLHSLKTWVSGNNKLCEKLASSCWVDQIITGSWSFVSVVAKFVFPIAEEITQFADQVKMRLTSQSIKSINDTPRVFKKLFKYFNT